MDTSAFDIAYKKLNPEQKKAVDTIEGPVIVSAGPGTGKTQILALRIANILKIQGADMAENILALTFTNAGVTAMRQRLVSIIGVESAYRVNIYTFHSLAEYFITEYPDYFPQYLGARAIGDVESIQLIEEIVRSDSELKYLKTFASDTHYTRSIVSAIGELKREGINPDEFETLIAKQEKDLLADDSSYYKRASGQYKKGDMKPDALKPAEKNKELLSVYRQYQDALMQRKQYDFSDTILSFIEATEKQPEFLAQLQEQFQYLLVDEHQDTNDAQNQVITRIGNAEHLDGKPNIFVVGDQKQAIYRFQGASVENFTDFQSHYPEHTAVALASNYRSNQNILDTVAQIPVSDEPALEAKNPERATAKKVVLAQSPHFDAELEWVANQVKNLQKEGVDPDQTAIIYREHKNLPAIKRALQRVGLPYQVLSRENILDDPDIKKLLLLLRWLANPQSNDILGQVLYLDFLHIDSIRVLETLESFKRNRKHGLLISFLLSDNDQVDPDIKDLAQRLKKLISLVENPHEPLELFETIMRESGYLEYVLGQENSAASLDRIRTLFDELKNQEQGQQDYALGDYLTYLETLSRYGLTIVSKSTTLESGVNLLTAHGSKGLEFAHVFVVHVNEGIWSGKRRPSQFKLPTETAPGDIDDERRLLYVAMTRAETGLYVSYSNFDHDGRERLASRFIQDFDDSVFEKITVESQKNQGFSVQAPHRDSRSLLDPQYIQKRFFELPLSVSALNNYFKSPLMYFFRNFLVLPAAQNKSMLYGNIIHKALELYFKEVFEQGQTLPEQRLLHYFNHALDQSMVTREYYEEFKARGAQTLSSYYKEYSASWATQGETEHFIKAIPFVVDPDEPALILRGIIDKLELQDDGSYRVIDYKTGKPWSEKSKEDKEGLVRQLVFYKLLLDNYAGGKYRMGEAVLDFVEPNKKGEYEQYAMQVSAPDVEKLEKEILEFAKDISEVQFLNKLYLPDVTNKEYLDLLEVMKK